MSRDNDVPPAAAAREHARGARGVDEPDENEHGPLVGTSSVRALLSSMVEHYDPEVVVDVVDDPELDVEDLPATVEDTELYQDILARESTETISRAVYEDREGVLSYSAGNPEQQNDISGLSAIRELEKIVGRQAPIIYLYGPPGSGKTNLSMLLTQLWKAENPEGLIGSNIRTWEEADEWIPKFSTLENWLGQNTRELDEGGITQTDAADPLMFVFDEASSHASGRGKEGYEAGKMLGPLVYKIRKSNAGLIIIGHDGRDVHPAVRELSTVIKRERGKLKHAEIYESVRNREGIDLITELDSIPETDYHYDDKEATSWSFDTPEQDQQERKKEIESAAREISKERARRLAAGLTEQSNGLDQTDIGEAIGHAVRGKPFTQAWVSKSRRKYEDELKN